MTKLINELNNNKRICRTAPATTGLFNISFYEYIFLLIKFTFSMKRKPVNRLFLLSSKYPLFKKLLELVGFPSN